MEEEGEEEKLKAASDNPAESTEPAADEPGTSAGSSGRFYDCIFCKRGFTTAQALGGHMNIHRKDRARLRPTGSSSSGPRKGEEAYHPYARAQRAVTNHQPVEESNYVVYFPAASEESSQRPTERVQAGEELRLGLGGSGPKEEKEKEEEKEDLDLELRLGHSKYHESSSDL